MGHSESQGMGGSSNGYLKPRLGLVIFFKNSDIFVDIYREHADSTVLFFTCKVQERNKRPLMCCNMKKDKFNSPYRSELRQNIPDILAN